LDLVVEPGRAHKAKFERYIKVNIKTHMSYIIVTAWWWTTPPKLLKQL